jgi:hypothetical protein
MTSISIECIDSHVRIGEIRKLITLGGSELSVWRLNINLTEAISQKIYLRDIYVR